jgi:hypothetical protein
VRDVRSRLAKRFVSEEKVTSVYQVQPCHGIKMKDAGECGVNKTDLHLAHEPQPSQFGNNETYDFHLTGSKVDFACLSVTNAKILSRKFPTSSDISRVVKTCSIIAAYRLLELMLSDSGMIRDALR